MSVKFRTWIGDFGGPVKLAKALGLTRQAVYYWLSGKQSPRKTHMKQIIELSKNKLTYSDLMGE